MNFEAVFTDNLQYAPNTSDVRYRLARLKANQCIDFTQDAMYALIFTGQSKHGIIKPMPSTDALYKALKQNNVSYFFLMHVNSKPFGSYDDNPDVQMINDTFKMLKINQMDVIFYDYLLVNQR